MAQFFSLSQCLAIRQPGMFDVIQPASLSAIIGFTFKSGVKQTWLQTGEFILGQRSTMDLSSFTQSPLLCAMCLAPHTEYNYSIVVHKKNMTKTSAKPFLHDSHSSLIRPELTQA